MLASAAAAASDGREAVAELAQQLSSGAAWYLPAEQLPPPPLPRRERVSLGPGSKRVRASKRKRGANDDAEGDRAGQHGGGAAAATSLAQPAVAATSLAQKAPSRFTFAELFAGIGGLVPPAAHAPIEQCARPCLCAGACLSHGSCEAEA